MSFFIKHSEKEGNSLKHMYYLRNMPQPVKVGIILSSAYTFIECLINVKERRRQRDQCPGLGPYPPFISRMRRMSYYLV